MLLVWGLIVLECAKSSILPNGNFREFFLWRGGNFAFSKREFPMALVKSNCVESAKVGAHYATDQEAKPGLGGPTVLQADFQYLSIVSKLLSISFSNSSTATCLWQTFCHACSLHIRHNHSTETAVLKYWQSVCSRRSVFCDRQANAVKQFAWTASATGRHLRTIQTIAETVCLVSWTASLCVWRLGQWLEIFLHTYSITYLPVYPCISCVGVQLNAQLRFNSCFRALQYRCKWQK